MVYLCVERAHGDSIWVFSGDIVGENVELEFVKRVRGMEKFGSVEELVEQMRRDVEEVRRFLS